MGRSVKQAVRALALAGGVLVIESAADTLPAQTCNDGGILVSTIAVAGLAVVDIATAPASARRYNEGPVAIVPYVNPRARSYGVSVSWFYRKPMPVVRRPIRVLPVTRDSLRGRKSPGTAFALSFFSTTAPMAAGVGLGNGVGVGMFLAGIVVGPSVGHFYAGQTGRGLATAALRGAGTAVFIASIVGCFD